MIMTCITEPKHVLLEDAILQNAVKLQGNVQHYICFAVPGVPVQW